jgi:hypothetical protein
MMCTYLLFDMVPQGEKANHMMQHCSAPLRQIEWLPLWPVRRDAGAALK